MTTEQHKLVQIKSQCRNKRVWRDMIQDITIHSNDTTSGKKFYIGSLGESSRTIYYPTPTAAAIAFSRLGKWAVKKYEPKNNNAIQQCQNNFGIW